MNVLTDFHHADLYFSLHLLFEKRLGYELFRPIGYDWYHKGFWKIGDPYPDPLDTAKQYLELPKDGKLQHKDDIQKCGETELIDGIYEIPFKVSDEYYIQKAITFNKFLEMDFNIILATYFMHDKPYWLLVHKYKPNAIYLRQVGNIHDKPRIPCHAIVATNEPMPDEVRYIRYYPEHHRDYCYAPPSNHNIIRSFIHCLPEYPESLSWFTKYEERLPELIWKMHGGSGRDGAITNSEMPKAIKDSALIWHVKHTGCEGLTPRQAMACGRPVIIKKSWSIIRNTLEQFIYEDGVNCIDLDLYDDDDNVRKIKHYLEPQNHLEFCKSTAESFKEKVNFENEAERIKKFLRDIENNII